MLLCKIGELYFAYSSVSKDKKYISNFLSSKYIFVRGSIYWLFVVLLEFMRLIKLVSLIFNATKLYLSKSISRNLVSYSYKNDKELTII